MKLHGNAGPVRTAAVDGAAGVEQGWTLAQAAEAAGVSVRTVSKWLRSTAARASAGPRPLLGAALDPASHARAAGAGDRACAGCG